MRAHSVWAIHFLNRDLSNLGNAATFPISTFCDDPPSWPMHMTSAIKNAADSLHGQEMVVTGPLPPWQSLPPPARQQDTSPTKTGQVGWIAQHHRHEWLQFPIESPQTEQKLIQPEALDREQAGSFYNHSLPISKEAIKRPLTGESDWRRDGQKWSFRDSSLAPDPPLSTNTSNVGFSLIYPMGCNNALPPTPTHTP